jgi:hypothetical protein
MTLRRPGAWLAVALAAALAAGCSGTGPGGSAPAAPTTGTAVTAASACVENEQGTGCLPIAPDSARVDRAKPRFSDPTRITNARFPVGELTQVLQLGHEGSQPLRVEVTRLPTTRTFTWDGQRVETVASQFTAFLGGRIREIAIDYFAQADDGSVWYFGEDVANYEEGRVADHDGSWLAGEDGPAGMIMPGQPKVGDVYRSENIPGMVFEQDTVKATGETVPGPLGPVGNVALVQELLMDGTIEEKAFAPGYGEFRAQAKDELVTVALALPVDAAAGAPPAALATLTVGARATAEAAGGGRWAAASTRAGAMAAAWRRTGAGDAPPLLGEELQGALAGLSRAVGGRQAGRVEQAAFQVEQAALDLQLRHRAPDQVDLDRLDLWARRLLADAAARDRGAVAGDVATVQVIWDRSGHRVALATAKRVTAALAALRQAADGKDPQALAGAAAALRAALPAAAP